MKKSNVLIVPPFVLIAAVLYFAVTFTASAHGQSLVLVEDAQPLAVIVIADKPSKVAKEAAEVLQKIVQQMTTAQLPIQSASEFKGDQVAILIGMSKLAEQKGISVAQNGDAGDHYVIRTGQQYVAAVGNDGKMLRGSVYAVYDLLQRLGCGWYGPDPLWQVIPERKNLAVEPLNIDVRPAFEHRHIWIVPNIIVDAWRLGGRPVDSHHALNELVPRSKYLAEHPDYFGKHHPCLTHPEVIQIVVNTLRERIDKKEGVVDFALSPEDIGGFCECERCRSFGNISSRLLYFANSVARELAETHPNRYLLTFYAYWFTHTPPDPLRTAEPGVCVMQVNEGNHMQPWGKPDIYNDGQARDFNAWRKTGAIMAIYEWWIPGMVGYGEAGGHRVWQEIPWYSGETALENLRYWQERDVRYLTYETGYEYKPWPLRWPLFYVAARGMWDPQLTSEQIMTEACDKLYGPAAPHMLRFYQTIEKAMIDTKVTSKMWALGNPAEIYTPQIEVRASECLQAAAAVATDNPNISKRISEDQQMWENAKKWLSDLRQP